MRPTALALLFAGVVIGLGTVSLADADALDRSRPA